MMALSCFLHPHCFVAAGIECYVGKTENTHDVTNVESKTCDNSQTVCFKRTTTKAESFTVDRGCVDDGHEATEECLSQGVGIDDDDDTVENCYCDEDLCNSANANSNNSAFIFIGLLSLLFLK